MFRKILSGLGILLLVLVVAILAFWQSDLDTEYIKEKYTDNQSQYIEVDGLQTHYKKEGAGTPLLLIHGTASSLHTWDDWTKYLTDDLQVIRLDMPAFGITGPHPKRDYSIDFYTDFLNKFVERIGIDTFHLAGNSLGGQIAWNYTLKYPDKVLKLVLVDASGVPKEEVPPVFKMARNPLTSVFLKIFTPRSFIEKNIKEVYYDDSIITDPLIDRYFELSLRAGNRQAFIDRARLDHSDKIERLSEINTPTLIQWGRYDEWIPIEDAFKFQELIPNSSLIIYEAGHVPMEEMPVPTSADVLDFLVDVQ